MAYNNYQQGEQKAKWNQGDAIKERLHKMAEQYNYFFMVNDFEHAFNCLNAQHQEIFPKLSKDERLKLFEYQQAVIPALRKYLKKAHGLSQSLRRGGSGLKYKLLDDLNITLDNYCKVLKMVQDQRGYGMPNAQDLLEPEEEW